MVQIWNFQKVQKKICPKSIQKILSKFCPRGPKSHFLDNGKFVQNLSKIFFFQIWTKEKKHEASFFCIKSLFFIFLDILDKTISDIFWTNISLSKSRNLERSFGKSKNLDILDIPNLDQFSE